MTNRTKNQMARKSWLNYFNEALYQKKLVTQREYLAMSRVLYK